jgi:hypothetical protein
MIGNCEYSFLICLAKSIPVPLYISIIHKSNICRLVNTILDASINDLQVTIFIFQEVKYFITKVSISSVDIINNIFLFFK